MEEVFNHLTLFQCPRSCPCQALPQLLQGFPPLSPASQHLHTNWLEGYPLGLAAFSELKLSPTMANTSVSHHNISLCILGASFFNKCFTLFQPREHSISHLLFMRQLLVTWLEHEHWDMTEIGCHSLIFRELCSFAKWFISLQ